MCFVFQGRSTKLFEQCYNKAWDTVKKVMESKCYRNVKNAPTPQCQLAMNKGFNKLKVFRSEPQPSVEQFNATEDAMMTSMGNETWTKIFLECEDICEAGSGSEEEDQADDPNDNEDSEEGGVAPPGSDKCTEDAFCDLV